MNSGFTRICLFHFSQMLFFRTSAILYWILQIFASLTQIKKIVTRFWLFLTKVLLICPFCRLSSATPLIVVFTASSVDCIIVAHLVSLAPFSYYILEDCGMKERVLALEWKDVSEIQICSFLMGDSEQVISVPRPQETKRRWLDVFKIPLFLKFYDLHGRQATFSHHFSDQEPTMFLYSQLHWI